MYNRLVGVAQLPPTCDLQFVHCLCSKCNPFIKSHFTQVCLKQVPENKQSACSIYRAACRVVSSAMKEDCWNAYVCMDCF